MSAILPRINEEKGPLPVWARVVKRRGGPEDQHNTGAGYDTLSILKLIIDFDMEALP